MLQKISSSELQSLITFLQDDQLNFVEELLKTLPATYDEHFRSRFDPELLTEFICTELRQIGQQEPEEFASKMQAQAWSAEQIMTAAGSWGMTQLIAQVIEKMRNSPIKKEHLMTLVDLINCRNQLYAVENEQIEKSYAAFLQKHLAKTIA